MIKTIALAYRRPGMTREEYNKYWLEQHAPLAAKLIPGVRRYVQNHLVEVPGQQYQGDGIVEMWYDDVESWQKSMASIRANRELMEDGDKFCQIKPGGLWVVQEHVIKDELK